jgi:nitrate/nitrite transport system substrate-binding protein
MIRNTDARRGDPFRPWSDPGQRPADLNRCLMENHPVIEKPDLTLGIVPLTDCAPIAVGVERGFFAQRGLRVTTNREASWASVRDKVAFGVLDGAQMIAPMTLATTLGIGGVQCDLVTGLNLDLNGNAITLSSDLFEQMLAVDPTSASHRPMTADALRQVIALRRQQGKPTLSFGVVFPISTHNYELRYWLASAGIDPDQDVNLVVVPPSKMVDAMKAGHIAGFCVGEPWNSVTVEQGLGWVAITKHELWNNSPEKVLAVTRNWAERFPGTHLALIESLIEACRWIDEPANRGEVCDILSMPQYVGVEASIIARSMTGTFVYAPGEAAVPMPDFNVFHRYGANYPWRSHAVWFLTQMLRWGQLDHPIDVMQVAASVYRPELYRAAASALGIACPREDDKPEGVHAQPWSLPSDTDIVGMGPELWFDGSRFDPQQPLHYLRGFAVKQLAVPIGDLAGVNPV